MDTWESLRKECLDCKGCSLADTRHNVVFGDGAENAELLFIGEGPGQHEDEQGKPFVGRAGKLLDEMLEMVNLDRSKVYIANIVKCRPPQNRDPLGWSRTPASIGSAARRRCCGLKLSSAWAVSRPRSSSRMISASPRSMANGSSGAAFG